MVCIEQMVSIVVIREMTASINESLESIDAPRTLLRASTARNKRQWKTTT